MNVSQAQAWFDCLHQLVASGEEELGRDGGLSQYLNLKPDSLILLPNLTGNMLSDVTSDPTYHKVVREEQIRCQKGKQQQYEQERQAHP